VKKLKKLMLLVMLLAMLVVAAVPAMAQVEQDFDQETESGDVDQEFTVTGEGSNGNQCVGVSGVANTGELQSATGSIQYDSDTEEFEQDEIESDLTVDGSSSTTCTQEVNQAAAAG